MYSGSRLSAKEVYAAPLAGLLLLPLISWQSVLSSFLRESDEEQGGIRTVVDENELLSF